MHGDKRVIVEELVLDEELFAAHKNEPLIASSFVKGGARRAEDLNLSVQTLIIKPQ